MSPPSRRSNNDPNAPHGSGRSPSRGRSTSSQPSQPPQQPSATVSGTHRGTANAGSVPWANHPPSNSLGTAPTQAQTAPHLFPNQSQPSRDDNFDYMLIDPAPLQQLELQIPDFYPPAFTTTSTALQPTSPLPQPQTIPLSLFPNQPPYSQPRNRDLHNFPQHQPSRSPPGPLNNQYSEQMSSLSRHQPSSSPPGPRNNQYSDQMSSLSRHQPSSSPPGPRSNQYLDSRQISSQSRPPAPPNTSQGVFPSQPLRSPSLSQPLVSPNTSQQGASPYATQPQYNPPPSSTSHRREHSSGYDNGRMPVANQPIPIPNRRDASIPPVSSNTSQASLSQPLVSPNTSQQGASLYATQPQYNPPPPSNSHRREHSSGYDNGRMPVANQPIPIPNRRDASIPPVSSNTSQASLSQPLVSPSTSQQGASQYYNSPPPSNSHSRRAHSSEYDNNRLPVAHPPTPNPNRGDASIRPTRPGEGERMSNERAYQPVLSVSTAPRTAPPIAQQPAVVPDQRQSARPPQATATASVQRRPSVPTCRIEGCRLTVGKDYQSGEFTEYCGMDHMNEALRLGVRVCAACNKFPRRTGREYCGLSCEEWAAEERRKKQLQQQQQQQQLRQGQPQQRPSQPQSSTYPVVPNSASGSVTWSNVAVRPTPSNSVSSSQPHVRGQPHR